MTSYPLLRRILVLVLCYRAEHGKIFFIGFIIEKDFVFVIPLEFQSAEHCCLIFVGEI